MIHELFHPTTEIAQHSCSAHKLREICATPAEARPKKLDAVQRTELRFGTFYWREHFSLAKPLHLAIMGWQLSNGWDAGFQSIIR
jgi:hypothetical protein